jgi:hypothetical protein
VTRHHAHAGDHLVMALGAVVVLACAAGIAAVMARLLGGAA